MASSTKMCVVVVASALSTQFGLVAALTPALAPEAKVDLGDPLRNAYIVAEMTEDAPESDWTTKQVQLESYILSLQHLRQQALTPTTTTAIPITTTERTLLAKINDLHRELCADPRRRSNPACASFADEAAFEVTLTTTQKPVMLNALPGAKHRHAIWLSSLDASRGKLEARKRFTVQRRQRYTAKARKEKLAAKLAEFDKNIAEIKAKRAEWERDLAARTAALGQELCDAPHRRSYAACQQFLTLPSSRRLLVGGQQAVQPSRRKGDQGAAVLAEEGEEHGSWVLGLIFGTLCAVSFVLVALGRQRKVVEQRASKPFLRC